MFFSIVRCMLVVEDVEWRAPMGNFALFCSEDHLGSSTPYLGEFLNEEQAVSMLLWESFTEETPSSTKREFYASLKSGAFTQAVWTQLGELETGGHTEDINKYRFWTWEGSLVHFQLRWLQEPWQPSGSTGEDGSERAQHITPASCWVFGSLFKFLFIFIKV